MNKLYTLFILCGIFLPCHGQTALSLDSCRAMALRNNKQLNIAKLQQSIAKNNRKAIRTKYLPKVDIMAGYELMSKEISILSNEQQQSFSNLGTSISTKLGTTLPTTLTTLAQQGAISPQMAQQLGALMGALSTPIAQAGNQMGANIVDALQTDTRQVWAASVMVRQPLYMGGAILAANKIADITELLADNEANLRKQSTIYDIDNAYWLVVSLQQKQKLATSYKKLVEKLSQDVHKMIEQGVATRADGLKVDVKVNEADMLLTQAENGVSLAKMLLCQLCGLPLEQEIQLVDEENERLLTNLSEPTPQQTNPNSIRPELRMLQNNIDISKQTTHLVRSVYMPHIMLTGGYLVSNPNMYNGFQRKFDGIWNVGVLIQMPIWNWFEGIYKVRASKNATTIAQLTLNEAQEKIELQISQNKFKLKEANKKLSMAQKNIASAEENLRAANLGFKEGVIESTDVMAAQTAWQQAKNQQIEAEIEVKLAQVSLNKALGILQ